MATFSSLPAEIRQQILDYVLHTPIPDPSIIKLTVTNTSALTLASVCRQFHSDTSIVHSTWRKAHPLEAILKDEWTREAAAHFKSIEPVLKRWDEWRVAERRRQGRPGPPTYRSPDQVLGSGHEGELDVEPDGVRLVRVLEWARGYMTHLRARGFEQKQRNRELERTIEVQRRWLREARENEERLELRVKMMEEGMDRLGLGGDDD